MNTFVGKVLKVWWSKTLEMKPPLWGVYIDNDSETNQKSYDTHLWAFLQSKNDSVTKIVLRHKGWLKNNSMNPWVKETNSFFISFSTRKVYIIENTLQSHRRSKHWQHWVTLYNDKYFFNYTKRHMKCWLHLWEKREVWTLQTGDKRDKRECRGQFYWSGRNLADPMLLSSYLRVPSCLSGISTLEIWEQFYTNFLHVIIRLLLLGMGAGDTGDH